MFEAAVIGSFVSMEIVNSPSSFVKRELCLSYDGSCERFYIHVDDYHNGLDMARSGCCKFKATSRSKIVNILHILIYL
ncbi:hypothetical protein [Anaplasma marginale]|uniref:hypothetical protein n=1 Tax=Anaplasma marginale TaxID=770 RepID=UPI0002EACC56|nr:hypothetical protein [Anaplasma marginale]